MKKVFKVLICIVLICAFTVSLFACNTGKDDNATNNGNSNGNGGSANTAESLTKTQIFEKAFDEFRKNNFTADMLLEEREEIGKGNWFPYVRTNFRIDGEHFDATNQVFYDKGATYQYDEYYKRDLLSYRANSGYYTTALYPDPTAVLGPFYREETEETEHDRYIEAADEYGFMIIMLYLSLGVKDEDIVQNPNGSYTVNKKMDLTKVVDAVTRVADTTAYDWANNVFKSLDLNISVDDIFSVLKTLVNDKTTVRELRSNIDMLLKGLNPLLTFDDFIRFIASLFPSKNANHLYRELVQVSEALPAPKVVNGMIESIPKYVTRIIEYMADDVVLDIIIAFTGRVFVSVESLFTFLNTTLKAIAPIEFLWRTGIVSSDDMDEKEVGIMLDLLDKYFTQVNAEVNMTISPKGVAEYFQVYFFMDFDAHDFDKNQHIKETHPSGYPIYSEYVEVIEFLYAIRMIERRYTFNLSDFGTTKLKSTEVLEGYVREDEHYYW